MEGSTGSLDFCPQIPDTERDAIPLECWQEINLSDIWIPSHLLPNRNKSSSMKDCLGIYHTLEKKDVSKYVTSFSVYSYDTEQGEIFVSDSDDDIFGSDSNSFEQIQISGDNTLPAVANNSPHSTVCSNDLKYSTERNILNTNLDEDKRDLNSKENSISVANSIHTGSQKGFEDKLNKNTNSVSLKDILDDTPEVNIKDSVFDFKKKDDPFLISLYDKKEKKVKKSKKDKVKKKTYIVLDNFLESKKASQDYYCDKYFQSILNSKQKEACSNIEFPHLASSKHMFTQSDKRKEEESCSNVHVESNMEFPYLASNECMFTQSDKSETEASCSNVYVGSNNMELPYLTSDEHMFIQSDKQEENIESTLSDFLECGLIESEEINENIDVKELDPYTTDVIRGKMVIENIPLEATKDDILAILCGYGEIKNFSLVPTGKFFTAYVEIDLSCDIDWIIECLNGSEPFGAATEKIYCYKQ